MTAARRDDDLRPRVRALEQRLPTWRAATVTATDPVSSTFDADVAGAGLLEGIPAERAFLPAVGDDIRLNLYGATPVYAPRRIGEDAITGREIAPGAVDVEQLAFKLSDYTGGTTIFYGSNTPTATGVGDLWLQEPANIAYRWNGTAWVEVRDQGIVDALQEAQAAQAAADQAAADAFAAQSTASGKITTFYQASAPTATATGDLWVETDAGNKLYRWSGSAWVAVQDAAISTALNNAATAQATADGKVRIFTQTSAPTGMAAGDVGDMWVDTDDDNRLYTWSGTAWVSRQLGNSAIQPQSLVASNVIATGTVTASLLEAVLVLATTIIAGDPTGEHARIDSEQISFLVDDPVDGAPNVISRFGRDAGGFDPATGRQTWAIPTDGRASLQGLSVTEDPIIQGRSLAEQLSTAGAGKIVGYGQKPIPAFTGIGVGEYGTLEVTPEPLRVDRSYRMFVRGLNIAGSVAQDDVWLHIRDGGTGVPTVSSPLLVGPIYRNVGAAGRYEHYDFSCFLAVGTAGMHRLLLTVRRGAGGTGSLQVVACEPEITIYETGPHVLNTGVANSGGIIADPGVVRRYDQTFDATWSATYNGANALDTSTGTESLQGLSPNYGARGNARAMVGFPDLTGLLAGVPTDRIELVEISMYANHWYYMGGGTAVIGYHGSAASYPGSFSGTTNQIQIGGWGRGQRRTVDVTGWRAALRDGGIRGFTLGPGPSTDPIFYGRFNGAGMAEPPRIRVVYYK